MVPGPPTVLLDRVLGIVVASPIPLFAVLNAGRDPAFMSSMREQFPRVASLLPDDLAITMDSHGPFLVEIDPASESSSNLITSQWDHGVLTLLWSPSDFDEVRDHLRHFIDVATTNSRRLLFRLYDPLTLVSYLPVFSAAQRRRLVSRIHKIITAVTPSMAIEFNATAALDLEITVAEIEGPRVLEWRARLAIPVMDFHGSQAEPKVVFNQAQMDLPLLANPISLAARLQDYLGPEHGPRMACYPRGFLQAMLAHGALAAIHGYGMKDLTSVCLFVDLQWRIAPGFHLEPRINAVLTRRELSPGERFERIAVPEFGAAWLAAERLDQPEHWFMEAPNG